ncbi:DUF4184 family protein [Micromonospora sp. WMMA1998]|uniref:DUF4184 family protein n=1 Tax=Micromonospora sp. WMMA1998 TaxID=3015167 RepID=UPI00248CFB4D|nr:DUF4184 family protein [Micromonospora sp. WMMA1998]WBC16691.1 DUF4184 family protein [Micromonospora sp. WMMA1998]
MPFTASHPAVVLPLLRPLGRLGVPPSALVVGSLAPDLPFYVTVTSLTTWTHSLAGAVSLDVLVGAVAFVGWRTIGRPAAGVLLPGLFTPSAGTVGGTRTGKARLNPLAVVAGLAVGALTHVVWDSFTHSGTWGFRHLPWLAAAHGPLPGYEWAQYVSTVVGLAVLAVWCARRARPGPALGGPEPASRRARRAWALVGGALVVGASLGVWIGIGSEADPVRGAVFLAATRGGLAALLAVAAIGVTVVASSRSSPAGADAPLTEDAHAADRGSRPAR